MSLKRRKKVVVERDIDQVKQHYIEDADLLREATGLKPLMPMVEEMEQSQQKKSVVILPIDDKSSEAAAKKLSALRTGSKKG